MSVENKAVALRDLICKMLRGRHTDKFDAQELRDYLYQAGVALHNIPFNVTLDLPLVTDQLRLIDRLDPTRTDGDWGDWVKFLTTEFEQNLPAKE